MPSNDGAAAAAAPQPGESATITGLFAAGPFGLAAFAVGLLLGAWAESFSWNTAETRVLAATLVVMPGAYAYGMLKSGIRPDPGMRRTRITSVIALLVGSLMLGRLVLPLLEAAFQGYVFPPFWGAVFLGGYAFVLAYAAAAFGVRHWAGDNIIFAVVLVGLSIITAAITTGVDTWWHGAISSLGTSTSQSAGLFSMACMAAGAMLVLSMPALRMPLDHLAAIGVATPDAARWTPRIMGTLGVLLFLVGTFPMDGGDLIFAIHNTSGIAFGVILVLAMLVTGRAFPGVPRRFTWYSWTFAGLSTIAAPLYNPIGYFSLAEVEVVVFALAGLWAVMLFALMREMGAAE